MKKAKVKPEEKIVVRNLRIDETQLPAHLKTILKRERILTVSDLSYFEGEFLYDRTKGIGPKYISAIQDTLEQCGYRRYARTKKVRHA